MGRAAAMGGFRSGFAKFTAAVSEQAQEEKEESDEEMGFGLFDDDDGASIPSACKSMHPCIHRYQKDGNLSDTNAIHRCTTTNTIGIRSTIFARVTRLFGCFARAVPWLSTRKRTRLADICVCFTSISTSTSRDK